MLGPGMRRLFPSTRQLIRAWCNDSWGVANTVEASRYYCSPLSFSAAFPQWGEVVPVASLFIHSDLTYFFGSILFSQSLYTVYNCFCICGQISNLSPHCFVTARQKGACRTMLNTIKSEGNRKGIYWERLLKSRAFLIFCSH